jgi:hypothetical protein
MLKDFKISWHKCLPHQDDMLHPRPLSQGVKFAINSISFHKNNIKQLVTFMGARTIKAQSFDIGM